MVGVEYRYHPVQTQIYDKKIGLIEVGSSHEMFIWINIRGRQFQISLQEWSKFRIKINFTT